MQHLAILRYEHVSEVGLQLLDRHPDLITLPRPSIRAGESMLGTSSLYMFMRFCDQIGDRLSSVDCSRIAA